MKLDLTYLLQREGSLEFKIVHGDPCDRLSSLQTGNAGRLILIAAFPGGKQLEGFLHAAFKSRQIRLEWFEFPDPETALVLIHQEIVRYRELREKHPGLRPEMLAVLAAKAA